MTAEQIRRLAELHEIATLRLEFLSTLDGAPLSVERRAHYLRRFELRGEACDRELRLFLGELLDANDREGMARAALLWPAFTPNAAKQKQRVEDKP